MRTGRLSFVWITLKYTEQACSPGCNGYRDRAALEVANDDSEGRNRGEEVRLMKQKELSWLRLLITIAIDWRFVIAVLLMLLLLRK